METTREKAIKIIKSLPNDSSLEEIIEQLKIIGEKNKSISAEAANDPELERMIAESREAYKAKEFLTTDQFLEIVSKRFSNE